MDGLRVRLESRRRDEPSETAITPIMGASFQSASASGEPWTYTVHAISAPNRMVRLVTARRAVINATLAVVPVQQGANRELRMMEFMLIGGRCLSFSEIVLVRSLTLGSQKISGPRYIVSLEGRR